MPFELELLSMLLLSKYVAYKGPDDINGGFSNNKINKITLTCVTRGNNNNVTMSINNKTRVHFARNDDDSDDDYVEAAQPRGEGDIVDGNAAEAIGEDEETDPEPRTTSANLGRRTKNQMLQELTALCAQLSEQVERKNQAITDF